MADIPPTSIEEFRAQLAAEEAAAVVEEPSELKAVPEPEAIPTSGKLVLSFSHSIVKRNEAGQIVEIIGEKKRQYVQRDDLGQIIAIDVVEESEEQGD